MTAMENRHAPIFFDTYTRAQGAPHQARRARRIRRTGHTGHIAPITPQHAHHDRRARHQVRSAVEARHIRRARHARQRAPHGRPERRSRSATRTTRTTAPTPAAAKAPTPAGEANSKAKAPTPTAAQEEDEKEHQFLDNFLEGVDMNIVEVSNNTDWEGRELNHLDAILKDVDAGGVDPMNQVIKSYLDMTNLVIEGSVSVIGPPAAI